MTVSDQVRYRSQIVLITSDECKLLAHAKNELSEPSTYVATRTGRSARMLTASSRSQQDLLNEPRIAALDTSRSIAYLYELKGSSLCERLLSPRR